MGRASIQGRIHSIETCGAVDGPGLRCVVYLQGCPLRCVYCHNPDCLAPDQGVPATVGEIAGEALHYKGYFKASGGGVTVSGGEPLLQPRFTRALLEELREHGIHTTLDTSGFYPSPEARDVLLVPDLVLLDIKAALPELHRAVTGVELNRVLDSLHHLAVNSRPVWIRFVLVPGWTDSDENVQSLGRLVSSMPNIERLEVLPFHKMGEYKWAALGRTYLLSDVRPPSRDAVARVAAILAGEGVSEEQLRLQ